MSLPAQHTTRERIMDAAGELFAEKGYRHTSVRDICARANANIAAVNYHFRDKEGLYEAILLRSAEQCERQYPIVATVGPPEERLAEFVRMLLFRLLGTGRPAWHGKLMAAEMADPTPALDRIVEHVIRPTHQLLLEIVRDLVGEAADAEIQTLAADVLGQCLYYRHARTVIERLGSPTPSDDAGIEVLARHITEFCIAGIKAYRDARSLCTEKSDA